MAATSRPAVDDPAPTRPAGRPPLTVAHVGLMGEQPGGMAQVVNQYLTWQGDDVEQLGILSTRRRRDWAAAFLTAGAAARIGVLALRARLRHRSTVAVFHVSEGGSFVREGSLLILARALGLRTVAHVHGAAFDDFATARPRLVSAVLTRAHAVALLTRTSESLVRSMNVGSAVTVVRNIVAPARHAVAKRRTVLFGGELSERKGVDTLLQAWPAVVARFPDWQLVLAGPVAPHFQLPAELPRNVMLRGSLTHSALLDELAEASIAVLPSRQEALPMFLLEALAHRCATIGSTSGQVPALLAEGVGAVIEPGDADGLAATIADLIGDAAARDAMAARGWAHVEQHYSPTTARAELEEFWRHAAGL